MCFTLCKKKKKIDHIIVGKRRENASGILEQEVELSEILKAADNFLSTSRKKGQETGGLALQQSSSTAQWVWVT